MPFSLNYLHTRLHNRTVSAKCGVLNIESERDARRGLHLELFTAGFEVFDAERLDEAVSLCRVMKFDVVVLNLHPDEHAVNTCQTLRSEAPEAVFMVLSESQDPDEAVQLLEAGADHCFAKTIYLPELIARLRASLRRAATGVSDIASFIEIGGIRLDPARRLVYKDGVPVQLSPREFLLLHHMMAHAGMPLSHESLMKVVWSTEHAGRIVHLRSLVRQLRIKLHDNENPQYLLTDSWIGYRFVEAEKMAIGTGQASRAA